LLLHHAQVPRCGCSTTQNRVEFVGAGRSAAARAGYLCPGRGRIKSSTEGSEKSAEASRWSSWIAGEPEREAEASLIWPNSKGPGQLEKQKADLPVRSLFEAKTVAAGQLEKMGLTRFCGDPRGLRRRTRIPRIRAGCLGLFGRIATCARSRSSRESRNGFSGERNL
jgi:hypothetical protein